MEPLKNMFNIDYYRNLATNVGLAYYGFNKTSFLKEISEDLNDLELNERLKKTTLVLNKYLPKDYKKNLEILYKVIEKQPRGYQNLIFPDYVSTYGMDFFDYSMEALEFFTTFGSSEFAIRHFLKKDFSKTIKVMEKWSKSKNFHVRRLSSEGSRPRLPWSFKLDEIIKNPKSTRKILENLNSDFELYVRKSVANHINDFTKDNKEYAIELVRNWNQENENTKWIIKHSMRNLIKKGDEECLSIFGFEKDLKIKLENFLINKKSIKLGENLNFQFSIKSEKQNPQKLVVDYAVHYIKKSGEYSKKVFKIKEVNLLENQEVNISKTQLFKDYSTRKHYLGEHFIEILINGISYKKESFIITE